MFLGPFEIILLIGSIVFAIGAKKRSVIAKYLVKGIREFYQAKKPSESINKTNPDIVNKHGGQRIGQQP
ncbi:MAG TPA: hypothetical protein ENI73_01510, partial [Spirochaetes bacterium]|nr:hypothetical protein [Spirochaetota bacterium]